MTLFLSDLHLGNSLCRADKLLDFLKRNRDEEVYLVGDLVDDRQLPAWPAAHKQVLVTLLERSLTYLPGNHDAVFRGLCGSKFGPLAIVRHAVYEGSGRKYYVTHGDEWDWLSRLTRLVPGWLRRFDSWHEHISRREAFKLAAVTAAAFHGCDGVICGHLHRPEIAQLSKHLYINCGDWIGSCTAVRATNGKFELVQ